MSEERQLWVDFREKEAVLKYYERMNLISRERIFAEADYFRAVEKIYNDTFQKVLRKMKTKRNNSHSSRMSMKA